MTLPLWIVVLALIVLALPVVGAFSFAWLRERPLHHLLLIAAAVMLMLPFVGVWLFMQNALDMVTTQNGLFVGAMVGSALGIGSTSSFWLLSLWQKLSETHRSRLMLRKALWVEMSALMYTIWVEALWWFEEQKNIEFGATELRLFGHIQAGVLNGNLSRISELSPNACDFLIGLRANLMTLQDSIKVFYDVEDRMLKAVEEQRKKLPLMNTISVDPAGAAGHENRLARMQADAANRISQNQKRIYKLLLTAAAQARQCARLLDSDKAFLNEQRAAHTADQWAKREESEVAMHALLDEILKRINDPT